MDLGFSVIGLIFIIMLFVPNIIWSKNKPIDYDNYAKNENKILSIFERVGQVLTICFSVIVFDFNFNWTILCIAFVLMILYEIYWIRYFKSKKNNEGYVFKFP